MVRKFVVWMFWRVVYRFPRPATDLAAWLKQVERTWWPWRKFKPCAYHNDDGNMWQVYLADEHGYTERRTLELDVHISDETGDIIGFDVWDENLKAAEPTADGRT